MAESKRLIKEYERVSKEDPACDLDALAARKKEMVQGLNAFVNRKSRAGGHRRARRRGRGGDGGNAAAGGARPARHEDGASRDEFDDSCVGVYESVRVYVVRDVEGREGSQVARLHTRLQVELQVMDTESVLAYGRGKMQETDDAIEGSQ